VEIDQALHDGQPDALPFGYVGVQALERLEDLGPVGVGDAEAQKIVAGRPYSKTSELEEKRILPPHVYDQVKHFVVVKP